MPSYKTFQEVSGNVPCRNSLTYQLGEVFGEDEAVALPPVLRPGLHGEHGAVVGLNHPGGQVAGGGEDAVTGQPLYEALEHLDALQVVGGVQVVDGLGMLGSQLQHLRALREYTAKKH